MSDPRTDVRKSLFERMRGPMTLLMIAFAGFALYYSLFFERKTSYYRDRNARLVSRLGDQVRRSIGNTARIVSNAPTMPVSELRALYRYDRGVSDEQRQPQAIFDDLAVTETKEHKERRFGRRQNSGLQLVFESDAMAEVPDRPIELATVGQPGARGTSRYASAAIPLQRLLNSVVPQLAGDVFDTVFILDASANVIYQSVRRNAEESDADIKIVRIKELHVPRLFEKSDSTLQVSDLMSASRQMPVRIGDTSYQLFSVPVLSTVAIEGEKTEADVPPDLWVVCGVVSNAEFRSRSLALSVTILSCLAAAFLLTIFAWPFVKMAMTSAQHKVTLVDVILLGISGILATSIVCLIVLDWFTFRKLEATADHQLVTLAGDINTRFRNEIDTAIRQLDRVQTWTEREIAQGRAHPRNANLLDKLPGLENPNFQTVFLINREGRQAVKWSVDKLPTPLTNVSMRRYYSAPRKNGREYLFLGPRRIAIESIHSATSPQPEIVFARNTADASRKSDGKFVDAFPVIAMTAPAALPIINPVMPQDFGFAIVDATGAVIFHSDSRRNTVENFFAETDDDPRVKAAIEARQDESMNIRYWGEDYRAYVQPMQDLPWTLITFRAKSGLRTLNAEALTVTFIFLLMIFGAGLLAFISLVLLFKPRYRAEWAWPDPARVKSYAELSGAYIGLLIVATLLFLTLQHASLLAFPFWFVPLVCVITYLYLRLRLGGQKRIIITALAVALTIALLVVMVRGRSGNGADAAMIVAGILLVAIVTRAVVRPDDEVTDRVRQRQTALPLCYVGAGFLLLLVTSVVPVTAFFKAAYELETEGYVKLVQRKLAEDLQSRWWRVSWEFNEDRGVGKKKIFVDRWGDRRDIYSHAIYATTVDLEHGRKAKETDDVRSPAFPALIESMLPRYSQASVKTRELLHDRAADNLWSWAREGTRLHLAMQNRQPLRPFTISSTVPALLPSFRNTTAREFAAMFRPSNVIGVVLALIIVLGIAFAIARFVARRVFMVDLVHPLWLSQGFLGLRHVLCYPCDPASVERLSKQFKVIDLAKPEDLEVARTAPQSFAEFEPAVMIDNVDFEFATGEGSKLVRELIERLSRNGDRIVILRPMTMNVITAAFLQDDDRESWAKTLSSFVWVNGAQLIASEKRVTFSGSRPVFEDDTFTGAARWRWRSVGWLYMLSGFHAYFEQFKDSRSNIERTLARETEADPYLDTLTKGLGTHATGREQLLDEISERAEQYYGALWRTCTANEQLVLMQIAQTGLVNGKTRKDVRRLLARGLLRRDPQLRVMNETFRRFVVAQCATSELALQLEQNLAGDAWNRFRVPFFAAIAVVMLFFFTTQRQTFDATIALVGGLAAGLPAFLKTLSGFGERSSAKAG